MSYTVTDARPLADDPNTDTRTLAKLAERYPAEVSNNPGLLLSIAAGEPFAKYLTFGAHLTLLRCRTAPATLLGYLLSEARLYPHRKGHLHAALANPALPAELFPLIVELAAPWSPPNNYYRHRNNPKRWVGDASKEVERWLSVAKVSVGALNDVRRLPDWALTALESNPKAQRALRAWRQDELPPDFVNDYPNGSQMARTLAALDLHATPEIIREAMREIDKMPRLAAAHNPSAPRHLLEAMLESADLGVIQVAELTLAQLHAP